VKDSVSVMEIHLHTVLTVVMLFFFGLISPGPNFIVVVQRTLNFGRVAGLLTGVGAATGDAVYATLGLFGVTRLVAVGGRTMLAIELLGGLYLMWLGIRMLLPRNVTAKSPAALTTKNVSAARHYWLGLTTDLANPKTVVFLASIFAVSVRSETPPTVRGFMLLGIVATSILWRLLLSIVFSTSFTRTVYGRTERTFERLFGAALGFFGLLLVKRAVL
jgi:amino acid exporter